MPSEITQKSLHLKTHVKPQSSLIKAVFWLIVILFLPQLLLGFGFSIFFGIQQGNNFTEEAFSLWFASISVTLILTLLSTLLTLPLLIKATQAENWKCRFDFWAVKTINLKVLIKWLTIGLFFWLASSFMGEWLNLPVEQFMLDVKSAGNSVDMGILIFVSICLVIPIVEELIFRGWFFSQIAETKLGNIGALILSTIIFALIHSQYEQISTFIMLLLLSLLLGYVRYKSNNISYSIAIHIIFNSLAIITLFYQS